MGRHKEVMLMSLRCAFWFCSNPFPHLPMHEVTFSTLDKPKLLSQLSAVVADVGLNIREAHVFSTADGYSLDVFVVDGWPTEDTEDLAASLQQHIDSVEVGPCNTTESSGGVMGWV